MTGARILFDEHVGRVFERVLQERGHSVEQAKDLFGEHTDDAGLLRWCSENDTVLISNNAKDFESLHADYDHAGTSYTTIRAVRIQIRKASLEQ